MDNKSDAERVTPPPESTVMTIAEMASDYRVSRNRIFDEMNAGRLAAKRIGGRVLISRVDANAWFAALPDREPA